jgi:hypothetical protein
MSTNYYLKPKKATPNTEDGMHLGLSAAGIFMFRAYPRRGVISLKALQDYLRKDGGAIVNEYGEPSTLDEFMAFVADRRKPDMAQFRNSPIVDSSAGIRDGMRFKDPEGYLFFNYEFS